MRSVVMLLVYLFAFLGSGTYILILAKSIGGAFWDVHLCLPGWALVSMVCLLPLVQLKTLTDASNLCLWNLLLIFVVVVLCTAHLLGQGPSPEARPVAGAPPSGGSPARVRRKPTGRR